MLFCSYEYLLFLPAIVALYWLLPPNYRLPMLLVGSYFFYMSWIPVFGLLILGMTVFTFLWGKLVHKAEKHKKLIFTIGIVVNLLCLGIFKYANFFAQSLSALTKMLTGSQPQWVVNVILPLAISFFIFEFIHYLFEIYRGRKPIDSFVLFALFAAFFPTQIAGPIKRYPDFEAQMQEHKKLRLTYFDEGVPLIVIGLAKKVLLADNLAKLVEMGVAVPSAYGSLETWIFAYAFAFQIYFDFSGYTDIARGSAMLFGYKIPLNFNMPYIAANMSEFWHRWHISLSTWLRDYLFIPLGGSRGGRWLTNRNLLLTMALGGLWHGASWSFVVWGVYHGLALIVHREFCFFKESLTAFQSFFASKIWHYASVFLTFQAVCIGWVFFRVENIGTAFSMVKKMVFLKPLFSPGAEHQLVVLRPELPVIVPITMLIVAALLILNFPVSALNERRFFVKLPAPLKAAFISILILLVVVFSPDGAQPFIYFQF